MNSFTISQLQDYSGIKAHTIRIWEQRYNALQPKRSEGNTRYYDNHQLRRLLNIVSLMNTDHKISQLCAMSDAELNALIDEHYLKQDVSESNLEMYVSQMIAAAFEFNETRFEKLFSNCLLRFGLKDTYILVIYPALVRLGLLWTKDALPPAHEHFIINLIRQKILTAIEALPPAVSSENAWLLFLPEDEFHETGLLIAYFLIRSAGKKVYYLGANVPLSSLQQTIDSIDIRHVLGFLVSKNDKKDAIKAINELCTRNAQIKFHIACNPSSLKSTNERPCFEQLNNVEELVSMLKEI